MFKSPLVVLKEWQDKLLKIVDDQQEKPCTTLSLTEMNKELVTKASKSFAKCLSTPSFYNDNINKLQLAEIFIWPQHLEGVLRSGQFSRHSGDIDTYEEFEEKLYNRFFANYYKYYDEDTPSISQLHYKYGVKNDFLFTFSPENHKAYYIQTDSENKKCPLLTCTVSIKDKCYLHEKAKDIRNLLQGIKELDNIELLEKKVLNPVNTCLTELIEYYVKMPKEYFHPGDKFCIQENGQSLGAEKIKKAISEGLALLYFLFAFTEDDKISVLFSRSQPRSYNDKSDDKARLESSLILAFKEEPDEGTFKLFHCMSIFTQRALSEYILETFYLQNTRRYARRAAASAILARNVSHNIGSHVLNKCSSSDIRSKLCSVYSKKTESGKLSIPNWFYLYNMAENMRRKLDRYMLKKWDYIAEITSAPAYAQTPASFFNQVVVPFLGNTLLIDNLVSMESLGYEWRWRTGKKTVGPRCSLRVKAEYVDSNGNEKEYRPSFRILNRDNVKTYEEVFAPYGLRDIQYPDYPLVLAGQCPNSAPDIDVLLPGPLGEFALYGIIENIIRNAAKHNEEELLERLKRFEKGELQQALTVTIQVSDEKQNPEHYTLRVSEDLSLSKLELEKEIPAKDKKKDLPKILDDLLRDDLINDDGSQRKENWGLAEIMICANLLAGKNDYTSTSIFNKDKDKDKRIVEVLEHKGDLTYEMRLLKPKRLAVICQNLKKILKDKEEQIDKFKAAGIRFFPKIDENIAGYSFILTSEFMKIPEEISESQIPLRRLYFGADKKDHRWLCIQEKPEDFIKSEESPEELLCRIWRIWLNRWKLTDQTDSDPHAQIELSVFLGKDESTANDEWNEIAKKIEKPYSVRPYIDSNKIDVSNNDSKYIQRVLYDRHGMLLSKLPGSKLSERTSYVMFDKLSGDFSRIISPSASLAFPYEVMEAGLLRVLIIDGRLAERAMNSAEDGDSNKVAETLVGNSKYLPVYWHIAKAARVMIATHISFDKKNSTPLHESSYKRRREIFNNSSESKNNDDAKRHSCPALTLNCFEKDNWTLSIDPTGANDPEMTSELDANMIDMVVVHRGDIDKFPEEWGKSNKFIENIGKHVPWVVVESGRGMPVEVQKGSNRFMPFSVLEQWFGGGRVAKLCMANLLMNLTRR